MKYLALLIGSILLLAPDSNAQTAYHNCDIATSDWSKADCWTQVLRDAELNLDTVTDLVYYRIDLVTYLSETDRETWKNQVNRANNDWLSYRNAECYSYRFSNGNNEEDSEVSCKASKTEDRIEELIARYELRPEWRRTTATYTITENISLKGLNRIAVNTPLPEYRGDKRGEVRLKIWISPGGRVNRQQIIRRDDPELAVAATSVLKKWRFSPLMASEPQEAQEGLVVFRFGE